MAEVDFSHARIQPNTDYTGNPTRNSYVGVTVAEGYLYGDGGSIVARPIVTRITNQQKQFVYQFAGTFSLSGTKFYVGVWTVTNVSFSSGDTFIFQIQADLICQ